jgi:hypothetical protein
LLRRSHRSDACRTLLALAASQLARGQPRRAEDTLNEIRRILDRSLGDETFVRHELAVLTGCVRFDLGRLDEALAVLSASARAAAGSGQTSAIQAAHLALARHHFWVGRYADSEQVLDGLDDPRAAARRQMASARSAVGRGDLRRAIACAAASRECAEAAGHLVLQAMADETAAFAYLSAGDFRSADHHAGSALALARTARQPLLALRTRLLRAECALRRGTRSPATALLRRTGRLCVQGGLPVTVRARLAMLSDICGGRDPADAARRHAAATGLQALALFALPPGDEGRRLPASCPSCGQDFMPVASRASRRRRPARPGCACSRSTAGA